MAVGAAVAIEVLKSDTSEHDALFRWLMQANASSRAADSYAITWAHGWHQEAGPRLATRALVSVDDKVSWITRVRYGTTTATPVWPTLDQEAVQRRAANVPSMLWPGWTLRILTGPPTGQRLAGFRRAAAALLLLPETNCTYQKAATLLGINPKYSWRTLTSVVVEQDRSALATILVLLARALDSHRSPIDYNRRRAIFSEGEVTVDANIFRAYCRQHRRLFSGSLLEQLRWYVRHLLLGAEPGSSSRSQAWHMRNSHLIDSELRGFVHQQAEANLHSQGIHEPLLWEPPQSWLPQTAWPGLHPEDVCRRAVSEMLTRRQPIEDVCQAIDIREDQFRLYMEWANPTQIPVPPEHPKQPHRNTSPQKRQTPQWKRLPPDELHRLYITERKTTPQIAALVGCTSGTIGLHLEQAGIERRRRKGPLRASDGALVTAEWLRRQYAELNRTTTEIAEELGCHNAYVGQLLRRAGIPTRPLFAVYSPLTGLGVQLSPAMQKVSKLRCHVRGLRHIIRLPGHQDIASACRTLGFTDKNVRYQLAQVEQAAGFLLFTRTRPLRMTPDGAIFIAEAERLLALLDKE